MGWRWLGPAQLWVLCLVYIVWLCCVDPVTFHLHKPSYWPHHWPASSSTEDPRELRGFCQSPQPGLQEVRQERFWVHVNGGGWVTSHRAAPPPVVQLKIVPWQQTPCVFLTCSNRNVATKCWNSRVKQALIAPAATSYQGFQSKRQGNLRFEKNINSIWRSCNRMFRLLLRLITTLHSVSSVNWSREAAACQCENCFHDAC